MAMNDEETVALVAGGHTFGKCHGAGDAALVGPEPEAAPIEELMGLGWKSSFGSGKGGDTIGSGIEGAWKPNPTKWDMGYLKVLFKYDWELVKSPAGANQWLAKDVAEEDMVVDAHDPSKKHRPMMTTADLSLKFDPIYKPIARRYLENPEEFADAFARAWFKLTHRDMGPRSRYLGPEVPDEELIWQDPVPEVDHELIDANGHRRSQGQNSRLRPVGFPIDLHRLGLGVHLPRVGQARRRQRGAYPSRAAKGLGSQSAGPTKDRAANPRGHPNEAFNGAKSGGKKVSLADLIVLGGCAGVEQAAQNAGHTITVPFTPGTDGRLQPSKPTRCPSPYSNREPTDSATTSKAKYSVPAEELLVDRAQLLTLTAPEMTVLLGGLRVLNANVGQSPHGVFTQRPEALTNDFFLNLLDMRTAWKPTADENVFEGLDRASGERKWTGTRIDLIFGSNSQLRALAEVYGSEDAQEKFLNDFVAAWDKVMNLDRFDLA